MWRTVRKTAQMHGPVEQSLSALVLVMSALFPFALTENNATALLVAAIAAVASVINTYLLTRNRVEQRRQRRELDQLSQHVQADTRESK